MPTEGLIWELRPPQQYQPDAINYCSPIDHPGHQAPPTTLRDTPGTQCCPAARQPMAICLATSGEILQGNLTLAPRTRRWLLSDWGHLPSTQPSRPNIAHPMPMTCGASIEATVGPTSHPNTHQVKELATLVTQKASLPQIRIMYRWDRTTQRMPRRVATCWMPHCLDTRRQA